MSSNEEKTDVNEGQDTLTREEAEQIRASAKGTLYVSIAVVLVWLAICRSSSQQAGFGGSCSTHPPRELRRV